MTAALSEQVKGPRAVNGGRNPNGRDGRSTDEYALPGLLIPDSSSVAVGPAATLVRVRTAALVAVSTTM
jgi:hypothetical protein